MTGPNQTSSDQGPTKDFEGDRLRQRLLAVERRAETLRTRERLFGVAILVALVLAAISAFTPQLLAVGGDEVELTALSAERFILKDSEGNTRGGWSVDPEGNSRLTIQDRQGRTRLSFSVLSSGSPGLSLTNANGRSRAALALLPDETVNLVFADGAGVPRTMLGLSRADAPVLLFANADSETKISIGLDGYGEPNIVLPESGLPELPPDGGS